MGKTPLKLSLFFTAMLFALAAHANEDGMSYSETTESLPSAAESADAPTNEEQSPDDTQIRYADTVKKAPPPRFDLENRARFRQWIDGLCKLEAVSPEESGRASIDGAKKEIYTAKNKQGSLQLLLENYVDDIKLEKACTEKISTCAISRKWTSGIDSLRAVKAQKSPLLPLLVEKRKARQAALKAEFFELRDLGALDGKTAPKAEKILQALKENSSCRTRSVQHQPVRSVAQK